VKVLGDQEVYPNDIIARQRGFKWKTGKNVIIGLDQTIHARVEGIVKFRISHERKVAFYYVDVEPTALPNRKHAPPLPYNYHPELFPERAGRNHPQLVAVDKHHVKLE
jgi:large subunit ribosomal protein L27